MRARVVGAVNVVSAGYMAASGIAVGVTQALGVKLGPLFLVLGLASVAVMVMIMRVWGKEGVRDLGAFLFKTLFRVEVRGVENMPAKGTRTVPIVGAVIGSVGETIMSMPCSCIFASIRP